MGLNRTALRTYAFAMLVACSPAIATAAPRSQAVMASSIDRSKIRIDNFGVINANYFRGAQPTGRDYADLAALGVKTIIDLQQDGPAGEAQLVKAAGMKFYRIGMTTHEPPTSDKLAQFLQLVNDPANQPVYVHCAGGRHRTGVMTAVYRMTHDRWTPNQAFQEMKQYKFGADFLHPEFKKYVYGVDLTAAAPALPVAAAARAGG